MAGLGEVFSHVRSIMFYLLLTSEYCRRNSENACNSQPCSWLPPFLKEVQFAELSNTDFSDPRRRLNKTKINAPKQDHEKFEQLLYHELIHTCVKQYIKINICTNEVQLVEIKTREQSIRTLV